MNYLLLTGQIKGKILLRKHPVLVLECSFLLFLFVIKNAGGYIDRIL